MPGVRIDFTIHYVEGDKYAFVVGGKTDNDGRTNDDMERLNDLCFPPEVFKFNVKDLKFSTLGYLK